MESLLPAAAPSSRDLERPLLPEWARSAPLRAAALAGFCLFLGALFASQIYLGMLSHGHDWWRLFAWQTGAWAIWGLLTPLVLALGRRLRLDRAPRWPAVLGHAGIAVGVALAHVAPVTALTQWIEPYAPVASELGFGEQYLEMIYSWFPLNVLVYWGILGGGYAWHYYRRFQERTVRASQLEARLARAELQALKLQLHPHFLFNSLNAVSGLVRQGDGRAAVKMLTGLSELLRYVLDTAERQLVPLADELDFVERYLEIQKMRFPDRLRVEIEAPEETLDLPVPNLVLQPLVENALEHGLAGRPGPGVVRVTAARGGGGLTVRVEDEGPGPGDRVPQEGVGLENTRARLRELYGERARLTLRDRAGGGAVAELHLPDGAERG